MIDDRIDGLTDQRFRSETKQSHGGIMGDDALDGTDHELVQHGQGVSHGTAAGTHREFQHAGLRLDALFLADRFQIGAHDLLRHQTERVMMGTRADGANHLVRFGGGEDEHHMLRRFLNDLEQRVEALLRDHVGLVEDENLVAVAGGGEPGAFAQFAGIVHTVV